MTDDDVPPCARPSCVVVPDNGPFCDRCVTRIGQALRDLPAMYDALGEELAPGSGSGEQRVSGSREAPLPLRTEVLSLQQDIAGTLTDHEDVLRKAEGFWPAGRARRYLVRHATLAITYYEGYDRTEADREVVFASKQHPPIPVTLLATTPAQEPLRRDLVWHPNESASMHAAARFLGMALGKLLAGPTGADAGLEILTLHRRARVVLGEVQGDVKLPQLLCPNPDCQQPTLVRANGTEQIECRTCGLVETGDRLSWLLKVLAVDLPELVLPAVRVAELIGVNRSTVSRWIDRGRLEPVACMLDGGRPLYRVGAALQLQADKAAS